MDIKKLVIEGLEADELQDAFVTYLAFEGFKTKINNKTVSELFIEMKLPSNKWRPICAKFVGIPWELSELDESDIEILQQMHEMLTI